MAFWVISRKVREALFNEVLLERPDDVLGVKKRVNRLGVIGGGLLGRVLCTAPSGTWFSVSAMLSALPIAGIQRCLQSPNAMT